MKYTPSCREQRNRSPEWRSIWSDFRDGALQAFVLVYDVQDPIKKIKVKFWISLSDLVSLVMSSWCSNVYKYVAGADAANYDIWPFIDSFRKLRVTGSNPGIWIFDSFKDWSAQFLSWIPNCFYRKKTNAPLHGKERCKWVKVAQHTRRILLLRLQVHPRIFFRMLVIPVWHAWAVNPDGQLNSNLTLTGCNPDLSGLFGRLKPSWFRSKQNLSRQTH